MPICFAVDEVKASRVPPQTKAFAEAVKGALAIGGDPAMRVLPAHTHALLGAVHAAFAEHRPLALSPDVVWLTIAQGVAQHVRLHAEALRPRLVRHDGRKKLEVSWDGAFPTDPASLAEIVTRFRAVLGEEIGDGRARLLTCDFSTTTDVERTASEIILLDAFSPYYDYELTCICGIPELTLTGTVDDWRAIRARVDVIAELDLGWWTSSLAPIADRLVDAASGKPDAAFFREIYKPQSAYGWERITGWIARLYPYVKSYEHAGHYDRRNPLLELPIDWVAEKPAASDVGPGWYSGPSITSDDVAARGGTCLVQVVDHVAGARFDVTMEGGVLAIAIDDEGRVTPRAAWTMRKSEGSIASVIEGLLERDDVVKTQAEARQGEAPRSLLGAGTPSELLCFYERIGGARLFVGKNEWRVRWPDEYDAIAFPYDNGAPPHEVARIVDLPDGTCLAMVWTFSGVSYLRVTPAPNPSEDGPRLVAREALRDVPIVGRSLATLLARAMAKGGEIDLPAVASYWDEVGEHVQSPPAPKVPLMDTIKGIFTGKKKR